jgi:hypothetical protein
MRNQELDGWLGRWVVGVFGIVGDFGVDNHCMCVHAAFKDIKFSSDYVHVPSGIKVWKKRGESAHSASVSSSGPIIPCVLRPEHMQGLRDR